MVNIREVLRRLVKYLILGSVVYLSCMNIPKQTITNEEIFFIIIIVGLTYCLLDMFTPSIEIVKDKNNTEKQN